VRVLVVGMGKSGIAACELLKRLGDEVVATDAAMPPEAALRLREIGVAVAEGFPDADLTVISPGVPADLPELRGRNVIGDLELASLHIQGPVLGITGSNGKTTTTALTGHILTHAGIANQVGGNIGVAPAAMVATSRPDQWNVLEISSFQLETTRDFRPDIGVCLNVTPNHLDRHHTFAAYAAAKARMFANQSEADAKVLNAKDDTCRSYASIGAGAVHWFNEGPLAYATPLRGRHNQENIDAACVATRIAGALPAAILAAVATFPGVEHRLEFVRELDGVRFYNDSKATSVDATLKAIAALDEPLWIILGGKDKGSDYRPLVPALRGRARRVLLVGAAAEKIAAQIGAELPVEHCGTIEAAVAVANREAARGDAVLLAPACASFDQFRSFEHRGEVFKEIVRGLREGEWRNG
jgi:UDP-N-acetylmuramoylalanine--D-glutamate ligase